MNNIYKLNAKKLIVKDEEDEEEEKNKANNEYERDEEYVEIDREKYKDETVFHDENSNIDINKNSKEDYVRSNLNRSSSSSTKFKRNSKIISFKSNSIENRSLTREKSASNVKQNQTSSDYVFKVRLLTERKTYWSEPLSVQCVKMNNSEGICFFALFFFIRII